MIPPHLPPPTCNIETHQRWQRIKLIIVVTCLALCAGIVGASVMLGWIWPMTGDADRFTASYYRSSVVHKQLEDRILQEVRSRIARVYSDVTIVNGVEYSSREQYVGDAYVVSSDGWLVVYAPDYKGVFKNWRVITSEGRSIALEKAVYDSRTKVLFLKVPTDSSQYFTKQAEFVDRVRDGDEVFVNDNGLWNYSIIEHQQSFNEIMPHSDGVMSVRYVLSDQYSSGSLVITPEGRVVGVVTRSKYILPSNAMVSLLSSVLSKGSIVYSSLGVEGWFDSEAPVLVDQKSYPGFFVDRVVSKQSVLKHGDIIISINDEVVDPSTMWYTIKNNKEVSLKIFRGGKIILLNAVVFQI